MPVIQSPLTSLLNRQDIWLAGQQHSTLIESISTGFAELDAKLAIGGWPPTGVVELLGDSLGLSQWLLPLWRSLQDTSRLWLWVGSPASPYGPALAEHHIDLKRFICVETQCRKERLWALEHSLASGHCELAIAWFESLTVTECRRLQLAAERGQGLLLLHLPEHITTQSHPVPLRLVIKPAHYGVHVRILKQRGGHSGAQVALPLPDRQPNNLIQGPW